MLWPPDLFWVMKWWKLYGLSQEEALRVIVSCLQLFYFPLFTGQHTPGGSCWFSLSLRIKRWATESLMTHDRHACDPWPMNVALLRKALGCWHNLAWANGYRGFLIAQLVKNLPAMQEISVQFLGWEGPLERGKAAHSSILAWSRKESDMTEQLSLSMDTVTLDFETLFQPEEGISWAFHST